MSDLQNKKIKIFEVGARDGLQNEKKLLSLDIKLNLIKKLMQSGLRNIELGSFVSEKKVPSMRDTYELCLQLNSYLKDPNYALSVLVPNLQGLKKALSLNLSEIAVFISCTESFSQKNINCSIKESLIRVKNIIEASKKNKIKIRAYLSVVFACPYEGQVLTKQVLDLVNKLFSLGVYEVSLGDTIGVAKPDQVSQLLNLLQTKGVDLSKIAMHFHDTQGFALKNISASLEKGICTFDSSVGGLGGCPYANGATGNVATEDVLKLLQESGYSTGIDRKSIQETAKFIKAYI